MFGPRKVRVSTQVPTGSSVNIDSDRIYDDLDQQRAKEAKKERSLTQSRVQ